MNATAKALAAWALGTWTGLAAAGDPPSPGASPASPPATSAPPAWAVEGGWEFAPTLCWPWENCCAAQCRPWAWFGASYVRPSWSDNPAYTQLVNAPGQPPRFRVQEFDYDYDYAPKVLAGIDLGNGWGVRGDYWRFHEGEGDFVGNTDPNLVSTGASVIVASGPLGPIGQNFGDGLVVGTSLRLDVVGVELTCSPTAAPCPVVGECPVRLALGVRHVYLAQRYDATLVSRDENGNVLPESFSVLLSRKRFQGYGPTVAAEARHEIGRGLSLYGQGRATFIFGSDAQDSVRQDTLFAPPTFTRLSTREDETVPIYELEIGAEWTRELGGTLLVVNGGWVGQIWKDLGNAAYRDKTLRFNGLTLSIGLQR
jgi:hypothetical protein